MIESRVAELRTAIESYQKLIATYTLARDRMVERRRNSADHVMIELDQRLEANQRTIAALGRAVEVARSHLKLIEEGRV